MKLIKKGAAGLLLALGTLILASGAYAPFNHDISRQERMSEAMACLLFGIPITGAGGWLVWSLQQQSRQETQHRLQSIFHQLLKQSQGKITVMQFALEAQLTADVAKQYLDERAKEFSADFNVGEDGEIYYCFHTGKS
jgi:large subunit ribosomal protein L7/L12